MVAFRVASSLSLSFPLVDVFEVCFTFSHSLLSCYATRNQKKQAAKVAPILFFFFFFFFFLHIFLFVVFIGFLHEH